jgi:hypothetical protein
MSLKTKIILGIKVAAISASLIFTAANAQNDLPDNCFLLWELKNSKYCQDFGEDNLGDYFLYACEGKKYSEYFGWYTTIINYVSFCGYTSSITSEENFEFLPLVVK